MSGTKAGPTGLITALGALGVVFGDIGTSPLYAFREALGSESNGAESDAAVAVVEADVLGVLSLMFWALIIVITIKYVLLVMRADNDGEGGILALVALIVPVSGTGATDDEPSGANRRWLILLGLFGTALLYGDGMITPAISVLAAVEGLEVAAPALDALVLPIVAVILIALFAIQHRGTETVGRFFGPVMVVWFGVLAVLGLVSIASEPSVMRALSPTYGAAFFADNGVSGFLVLGAVFLVVTGGEALYADMGHFGLHAIRLNWFALVLPSLTLNYLGQGALLLQRPEAVDNPFFLLAPGWGRWPLTILATAATIIASQALITGAYSLTVQAINLDYLPRLRTEQTSAHHQGQVYVPSINWFLLAACLVLVFGFGSSGALAAAYGVAVTLTMIITTMLVYRVARVRWNWPTGRTVAVVAPLAVVDLAFVLANLAKIPDGGWVPLLVGLAGFVIFTTWRTGRRLVYQRIERRSVSVAGFVDGLKGKRLLRHPGTGVYLHREPGVVPPALLANLRHNDALHDTVVLLSVTTVGKPHVPPAARDRWVDHDLGFLELEMRYGFNDRPCIAEDLADLVSTRVSFDPDHTTYFLGRERIQATDMPGMASWREHLFVFLHRNAGDPSVHFGLPSNRTVDIGTHVDL